MWVCIRYVGQVHIDVVAEHWCTAVCVCIHSQIQQDGRGFWHTAGIQRLPRDDGGYQLSFSHKPLQWLRSWAITWMGYNDTLRSQFMNLLSARTRLLPIRRLQPMRLRINKKFKSTKQNELRRLILLFRNLSSLYWFLYLPTCTWQRDRLAQVQNDIEQHNRMVQDMKEQWMENDEQAERYKREQRLKDARIRLGVRIHVQILQCSSVLVTESQLLLLCTALLNAWNCRRRCTKSLL